MMFQLNPPFRLYKCHYGHSCLWWILTCKKFPLNWIELLEESKLLMMSHGSISLLCVGSEWISISLYLLFPKLPATGKDFLNFSCWAIAFAIRMYKTTNITNIPKNTMIKSSLKYAWYLWFLNLSSVKHLTPVIFGLVVLTELCPYRIGAGHDKIIDVAKATRQKYLALFLEICFPRGKHTFLYL